jgi:hypothetical protein
MLYYLGIDNAVFDYRIIPVAPTVHLDVPGERGNAVSDHLVNHPSHQGTERNHAPNTNNNGGQDDHGASGVSPDVSPPELEIHKRPLFAFARIPCLLQG